MAERHDALALVELDSVARGYSVVDALVKRSPVAVLEANLVEPGKFLVLFAGGVAEVEEAFARALEVGCESVLDRLLLPMVHAGVIPGLAGDVDVEEPDALGVVEALSVASALEACDRALKDADVSLAGLRITPGLGGKAYFVVHGAQHDVEASIVAARAILDGRQALVRTECIPRPHADFVAVVLRPAPFQLRKP